MKLMLNGKEVTGMGHYVMAGDIKDATAEDGNVLSGKSYYNNNGKREGTMPNRGGMSAELVAGGSVSIPEGYHNGEGVVRAQDLASQTPGDAGAGNIDSGKTAWVNGAQVTGTSMKVDTSGATATAGDIASGKTAWVNGVRVTGSMLKGKKIATGQKYGDNTGYFTVDNLDFTPEGMFVHVLYGSQVDLKTSNIMISAHCGVAGAGVILSRGSSSPARYKPVSSDKNNNSITIYDISLTFSSSNNFAYVVWGE